MYVYKVNDCCHTYKVKQSINIDIFVIEIFGKYIIDESAIYVNNFKFVNNGWIWILQYNKYYKVYNLATK